MKTEKTLVIFKHDTVSRGLMGDILKRFERVGLKIVALEFIAASEDMGMQHYPNSDEWKEKVGRRTLEEYEQKGIDPVEVLGTKDAIEIGELVKSWNVDYLTSGPVLAMILEGPSAVRIVRKMVGETNPVNSLPGTIRGDYSWDNADLANEQKRPFYNLIHASGTVEEAEQEIELWFSGVEIMDYKVHSNTPMGLYGKL